MKKFLGLSAIVFLFSMCSTELDLLDDWKETCVIYGLLDQNQSTQYIRVQKAFLGPQNAFEMAQQYDSINYINTLDVRIEKLSGNNVVSTVVLQPDTFYNKQPGDFYAPMYVVYSFDQAPGWFSATHKYRLVVNNSATQNQSEATTHILENFNITYPSFGTVGFATNNINYKVEVKWDGVRNARRYQLAMYFQYKETDINSNVTVKRTPAWVIGEFLNENMASTQDVSYKFDPDGFYRFVGQQIQPDANVLQRESDSVIFVVYACGEELHDYMSINGPSTGIAQEKPVYTNITNGLGVFSARTSTSRNYTIPSQSLDSLSRGRFTCGLKFLDHNGDNLGCQ